MKLSWPVPVRHDACMCFSPLFGAFTWPLFAYQLEQHSIRYQFEQRALCVHRYAHYTTQNHFNTFEL